MAEKYAPETLVAMSGILQTPEGQQPQAPQQPPQPGMPPPPAPAPPDPMNAQTWPPIVQQALQLLKSPQFRDFRIDIETKSMAQMDEEAGPAGAHGVPAGRRRLHPAGRGRDREGAAVGPADDGPPASAWVSEASHGREMEGEFDRAAEAMSQGGGGPSPEEQKKMDDAQKQMQQQQQQLEQRGQKVAADEQAAQEERITLAGDPHQGRRRPRDAGLLEAHRSPRDTERGVEARRAVAGPRAHAGPASRFDRPRRRRFGPRRSRRRDATRCRQPGDAARRAIASSRSAKHCSGCVKCSPTSSSRSVKAV
jgi:hypothetical protein